MSSKSCCKKRCFIFVFTLFLNKSSSYGNEFSCIIHTVAKKINGSKKKVCRIPTRWECRVQIDISAGRGKQDSSSFLISFFYLFIFFFGGGGLLFSHPVIMRQARQTCFRPLITSQRYELNGKVL